MSRSMPPDACPNCGAPSLTNAQLGVLRLLADQRSTAEIAAELWLSTETVRWHLKTIYRRLGVHDRRAAAQCALELGLIHERQGSA